ncbi:MAG: GNAT family N-acetyltransferase [Nannocystaceae bacterium]
MRALKIHFIGVGGTGMGALAGLLKQAGHDVRGSDTALYPPMSTQLEEAGVPVFQGYRPENLDWGPERVVVGNICSKDHVEAAAAAERGIRLESFPSLLADLLLKGRRSLVVAGTHGKTTTSSLVSWLLHSAGADPSFLIGGVPLNIGRGAQLGGGEAFVLEGDEYDTAYFDKGSKFLHYRPTRAILTSVEFDHADIFADLEAVVAAFERFVALIPPEGDLVVAADDVNAMAVAERAARCRVNTYRLASDRDDDDDRSATYLGRVRVRRGTGRTDLEIFEEGESLGIFSTTMVGDYNLSNLIAAVAICRREGIDAAALRDGARRFRGVKRRQELLGLAAGVRVITDFAHHPTAVRLTVTAIRRLYRNNALHVCFEPRSASSRRAVFQAAYADSFRAASQVYVGPLFAPGKIPEEQRLDPNELARAIGRRGTEAHAFADVPALADSVLSHAVPGDTVLLLTCGAFDDLGNRLLRGFGDAVMFAAPSDMPNVNALVQSYDLPPINPSPHIDTLVIRDPEGGLAGSVSLLTEGEHALLFNLVIDPDRRGEGLGWILADTVLRRARILGAAAVYLQTTGAADFFGHKLGFVPTEVAAVDPAIRRSPNFTAPDDAVCMVHDLRRRRRR